MKTIIPIGIWIAVLLALAMLFHPKGVLAQGLRAESGADCSAVSDMAMTARALDKNQVAKDHARRIMLDLYGSYVEADPGKYVAYIDAVIRFAGRESMKDMPPPTLGTGVELACRKNRGDLSTIFGRET